MWRVFWIFIKLYYVLHRYLQPCHVFYDFYRKPNDSIRFPIIAISIKCEIRCHFEFHHNFFSPKMPRWHTVDSHSVHSKEHETAKKLNIYASARFSCYSPRLKALLRNLDTIINFVSHCKGDLLCGCNIEVVGLQAARP